MSGIEERLTQTLARQADSMTGAIGFGPDEVVLAGRQTRVRRRRMAGAAVAAAVAIVITAGALVANHSTNGAPPIQPATTGPTVTTDPTATISPSTTASPDTTVTSISAASIGLGTLSADTIVTPEGTRIPLSLPDGYAAQRAVRVPGGWVVEGYLDGTGFHLWFKPENGPLRTIGRDFGDWAVSPDGHTLAVAGAEGAMSVVAYRLPTVERIRATTFNHGMGPVVLGIGGGSVLFREASGDGSPTLAASWNLSTGEVRLTNRPVNAWAISDSGGVLRWVPEGACVDVVPIASLSNVKATGRCDAGLIGGSVSPDGHWVHLLDNNGQSTVVSAQDLRGRRWSLPADTRLAFWDTGNTFVASGPSGEYYRCRPMANCEPLTPAAGFEEPKLIPYRGI